MTDTNKPGWNELRERFVRFRERESEQNTRAFRVRQLVEAQQVDLFQELVNTARTAVEEINQAGTLLEFSGAHAGEAGRFALTFGDRTARATFDTTTHSVYIETHRPGKAIETSQLSIAAKDDMSGVRFARRGFLVDVPTATIVKEMLNVLVS